MNQHEKINYIEFPSRNLKSTKAFFIAAFGWEFTDYGPDYTSFSDQGVDGGFYTADLAADSSAGSALIVLYSSQLEETQKNVLSAGGTVTKPVFSFPGGRRFHFTEPSGNELAVWSDGPAVDKT